MGWGEREGREEGRRGLIDVAKDGWRGGREGGREGMRGGSACN